MHALDHARILDASDIDVVLGNTQESYRRLREKIEEI